MSIMNSPNMNLPIPTVGSEPGPNYATDVNNSLTLIDQHTHLPGSGVYITPGAIDINTALTFNDNFATNLAGVTFTTQTVIPAAQTIYVKLGTEATPLPDLFYFDGTNTVQLTAGGLVNATIASIPGESYAGGTFTWRQGTGSTLPANFDIGNTTLRPPGTGVTGGTGYVTLTVPSSIGANQYNVALPLLPATNPAFLTIDTFGNMASTVSTVGGITGSMIAPTTVTNSNLAGSITASKISTVSATSVLFTGCKVTYNGTFTRVYTGDNLTWNAAVYGTGIVGSAYTVPATGKYRMSTMVTLNNVAGGQQAFIYANVNGSNTTAVAYGTAVGNGQPNTISGSTTLALNAGDTLILQIAWSYDANNRSQNGDATYNWWSIEYVGQ